MKNTLLVLMLVLATTACFGKKPWSQSDRDKLIGTCVEKTMQSASLDKTKATNYCTCYQQNLEKDHPYITDLVKMSADEMSKSAQACLSMITQ